MHTSHTTNVDKLTAAQLIEVADLTQKEIDLINNLSHAEIDAIVSAGTKFKNHAAAGERAVRVLF